MILNLGPLGLRLGKNTIVRQATLGDINAAGAALHRFGEAATSGIEAYGNYYATSAPAYRAIKLRADAVASAPFKVYRRATDGTAEAVESGHPAQALLDKVNGWWTAADLWKATETNLCLWGSAFWFLERVGGQVRGIWPIRPDKMSIVPDTGKGPNRYIAGYFYQGISRIPLANDEVIWFRYFNPLNEFAGLAPIAPGRAGLDMGHAAVLFNRNFFLNGAMPQDLIFPVQGPIPDEEIEDFYRRLEKRHRGAAKAHRPMIWDLSQGGKPERLGLSQRDMEFMAGLDFTVEEAARIWGVPPPKLFSQKSTIYNNVKQADIAFYTDTIASEWHFLESEVTEMLMPLLGYPDLYCAFDTSNNLPLQEALADQITREIAEIASGTLTINEARTRHGRAPVEWGDTWWKPVGLNPWDETPALSPGWAVSLSGPSGDKVITQAAGAFGKMLTSSERLFRALQNQLFTEQKHAVLAKLRQHHEQSVTWQVDDSIFNQEEWNLIYGKRGKAIIATILGGAAQSQASAFGLGVFNPESDAVRYWVAQRTLFWADRVNLETAQLLMAELADGRAGGESIRQIQNRIEKVFKFNDIVRSERIARTETLAAANKGHLEAYKQSGVVEEKMWLTAIDERTRDAHAAAHRQVVALQAPFFVGGEELEAPGIGGSPGNTINCRCAVLPVIQRRQALAAAHIDGTRRNGDTGI